MYSAMIFSVVSERFRLTRSVRRDMVEGKRRRKRGEKYNTDGKERKRRVCLYKVTSSGLTTNKGYFGGLDFVCFF
jgi:hypothetical protein